MSAATISNGLEKVRARVLEYRTLFLAWVGEDRRRLGVVIGACLVVLLYLLSRGEEKVHYVYEGGKKYAQERVIENPYKHIAQNKIDIVEESEERLRMDMQETQRQIGEMRQAMGELVEGMKKTGPALPPAPEAKPTTVAQPPPQTVQRFDDAGPQAGVAQGNSEPRYRPSLGVAKGKPGPYSVSFPVAVKREEKATGVVIPSGSYVRAKIVSGVQVPMGETYPALLQLDFAFVKPSNRRIDLSGCFIVAKAEGDISTERLQMSPDSMSCYNTKGMYFKKDKLVGWVSDTKDNDFALRAEVDLHQGRVAQTAFAKALIDGLGQSLERNTKSIGGKGIDDQAPAVVLRDSGQQVGSMVADYYLSYLKGLRPSMKVTSGRDAWLVLGTDVEMPYDYFKKEESDEGNFDFVTDIFK